MQTIKTGVVVALLLAVCYGAFVALNAPEPNIPTGLLDEFDWSPDEAGLDELMKIEMSSAVDSGGSSLSGFGNGLDNSGQSGFPGSLPTSQPSGGFSLPGNFQANNLPSGSASSTNVVIPSGSAMPAFPTMPGSSANASPTNANLPGTGFANNSLPGSSAGLGLPALPTDTSQMFNAADGPAVALNSGAQNSPAAGSEASASPAGQLVSQARNSSSLVNPSMSSLSLLDSQANNASSQPAATATSPAPKTPPSTPFPTAREQALELASKGKLRDALQQLSLYYDSPELTHDQHEDLVDILDALSREVIYSDRHLAWPAHWVTASDTVASLSQKFQITEELFRAINGLSSDSNAVIPGKEVKILQGPFRAQVSLNRGELTVFLGDLYAGRFPISLGADPTPIEGVFEVVDRRRDRTYYGTGGKIISATDPRNPYGGYWLNLGQDLCIHGTPEMASSDLQDAGCISLAPLDASDVYNILTQGAQVTIAR